MSIENANAQKRAILEKISQSNNPSLIPINVNNRDLSEKDYTEIFQALGKRSKKLSEEPESNEHCGN